MGEIDKLEQFFIDNKLPYARIDDDHIKHHQILAYREKTDKSYFWDALAQTGEDKRYPAGLLEVMGGPVLIKEDNDTIRSNLTAEEIIERYKNFMIKEPNKVKPLD